MNAAPADQRRLLDLAEIDSRIRRADHERRHPRHADRIRELLAERQSLSQELSAQWGRRDDLRAEQTRIEADVAVVDARVARDGQRLAASTNAKDAQGLESELSSLARRKGALEDTEIEVMERLELVDAEVAKLEARIAELNDEGSVLTADDRAAVAEAEARWAAARRDRDAIASSLPASLVASFDRAAARNVGAALLRAGTCEGCRMVLAGTDLAAIRAAAADQVITCPECECILVRTDESGL